MGRWRCTFSTWVLFSLCMFLYAQHGRVPPGLAYWGSGFSQPWAPSLRAWRSARRSLRLGVGVQGWRARVCQPWGRNCLGAGCTKGGSPWTSRAPTSLGIGLGPRSVYCVRSVYEVFGLAFFLFLFVFVLFFWGVAWRSVACSVYGALGWDPCGVHNVCSVYEAFGLALLVAFRVFVASMGHWGGILVAFTALVAFMGHWGWTFVAFKKFVLFMECLGWAFVAVTAFVAFMRRSGWSFL